MDHVDGLVIFIYDLLTVGWSTRMEIDCVSLVIIRADFLMHLSSLLNCA